MNDDFFMRVWNKQRVSNEMGYISEVSTNKQAKIMKKKNTKTNSILPQREKVLHVEIAAVEAETAPTPMEMMPLLH